MKYIKCRAVIFKNSITRMSILSVVKLIYAGKGSYFPKGQAWQTLQHRKSFKNYRSSYFWAQGSWKSRHVIKSSYIIYINLTKIYLSWTSVFQMWISVDKFTLCNNHLAEETYHTNIFNETTDGDGVFFYHLLYQFRCIKLKCLVIVIHNPIGFFCVCVVVFYLF